jgi:hypothetical protein
MWSKKEDQIKLGPGRLPWIPHFGAYHIRPRFYTSIQGAMGAMGAFGKILKLNAIRNLAILPSLPSLRRKKSNDLIQSQ